MLYAIIIGYLIGSIPFSFIIPKLVKGIDIRTVGSGNVGSTNVYRSCGIVYAILAFLGDSGKGFISIYIANHFWGYNAALAAALATVIGHCYTFVLKFKGGKGVATLAGTILVLNPVVTLILIPIELGLIFTTKMVSLASIISAALFPVVSYLVTKNQQFTLFSLCAGLFVIFQHRSNIVRIINGEEKKLHGKKISSK